MKKLTTLLAILAAGLLLAPAAFATNGMNLEGYGPVAHAMGGASMAHDNGSAAMMNNPATLGLLDQKFPPMETESFPIVPDEYILQVAWIRIPA